MNEGICLLMYNRNESIKLQERIYTNRGNVIKQPVGCETAKTDNKLKSKCLIFYDN